MPVTVLQQGWGAAPGYDAVAPWDTWAADLRHETVTCGRPCGYQKGGPPCVAAHTHR
jgi:hypothetical protein